MFLDESVFGRKCFWMSFFFSNLDESVPNHCWLAGFQNSETSYFQSHVHFDDSVESIADPDIEDGESQKILTSPLYAQKALERPDAMVVQEREVSAQNTQADRKGSLRSHSSEGQEALEKPNASFSSEQENLIRCSVFRNANLSNLRGSLLEGNKDHMFNQARSDLAKQELHVESLNECIGDLQQQTEVQRLALQNSQNGFVESGREQGRLQEELILKEQVLRNTQIRNMHEMGEIKRAQEQRVDEVSVQKLKENHETIQQLTSQLQQMQDQMNSMSDSGDFPRCGTELQWKIVSRFQSTCDDSEFSLFAQPRQKIAA